MFTVQVAGDTFLAIDPTAPVTPLLPVLPTAVATDTAAAALARAAISKATSTLSDIVGASSPDQPAAPSTSARNTVATASRNMAQPAQRGLIEQSIDEQIGVAVRQAVAQAAPNQAGLAPMMANLKAALERVETPETVRIAAMAVLDKSIPTGRTVTSAALRDAVQTSGVFMEARLARAMPRGPDRPQARDLAQASATLPAPAQDMKAALLVFRAAVSTWLARAPGRVEPPAGSVAEPTPDDIAASTYPRHSGRMILPSQSLPAPLRANDAGLMDRDTASGRADGAKPVLPEISVRNAPSSPSTLPGTSPSLAPTALPGKVPPGPVAEIPSPAPTAPAVPGPIPVPTTPIPSARPLLAVGLIEEDEVEAAPLLDVPEKGAKPGFNASPYAALAQRSLMPSKPPPPYAGGPTAAQGASPADLPSKAAPADIARRLLGDVDSALARQELLQIASLPEARRDPERIADSKTSRWVFELPFQTPQGVAVAQFEVSRDGGGGGSDGATETERTWRARFSMDVEPLGPVHVQIALTGVHTRVGLWAERPESMAHLRSGEEVLSAALRQAELSPEVAFHMGSPVIVATGPGHFVDRAS